MCLPADGGRRHTFSINRRQAHGTHPHGETCPSCDVKPGLAQGPIALTDFFHTANEIGQLLALVGRGTSLRKASQLVRYDAQRFFTDTHGHRWASREFALAARYLDQFADLIDTELAPKSWPKILVLDSKPLLLYPYDADEFGEQWDPNDRAGAILVAAGGDDPRRQMKAWRIGLAGDETRQSWLDFLSQLPGDVEWVVADGAKAIEPAVRERWPNARFFSCEFHLGRALRSWAESDGWHAEHPAIKTLLAQALWSVADWDALRAFAEQKQAESILRWMDGNELRVRRQLAHRQRPFHRHPRSNSEAEYVINSIDRKLTRRRRFRLRNARRLQMILNLMRADFAGQGGAVEYAAMVKRHLERLDWRFDPDWNVNQDDSKQLRSLSRVLLDSRKHRQQASAIYMADAKMRSVLLRIQEDNAIRASLGYPPLEFEIKPGQRTVSVTVAGMMPTDFPEISRDWDHAKNTLDPLALRAGSDASRTGSAIAVGTSGPPRSVSARSAGPAVRPAPRTGRQTRPRWQLSALTWPSSGTERRTGRAFPRRSKRRRGVLLSGAAATSRPTTRLTACRRRREERGRSAAGSAGRCDSRAQLTRRRRHGLTTCHSERRPSVGGHRH